MSDNMTKPIPAIKTASDEEAEVLLQPYLPAFTKMFREMYGPQLREYTDDPRTVESEDWGERYIAIQNETFERMKRAFPRWVQWYYDGDKWAEQMLKGPEHNGGGNDAVTN